LNYEEHCTLGILAVLVLEGGCMMGPKYKRPAVNVPQEYRTPEPQLATQTSSLGNEQWWQLYQDPVLTQLIHTAIAQNYDVRIARLECLSSGASRHHTLQPISVRERRRRHLQPTKRQGDKGISRLPGQRGRPESIGDLESRLLGEVSQTDRGGSSPITRHRVGAASGDFFSDRQCSNSLFPATGARQ